MRSQPKTVPFRLLVKPCAGVWLQLPLGLGCNLVCDLCALQVCSKVECRTVVYLAFVCYRASPVESCIHVPPWLLPI